MICAQARGEGVSVSQVARRFDVNANLVFTWLRDPRFGAEAASFLPVEVTPADPGPPPAAMAPPEGRIEIEAGRGVRLRVTGGYDPDALARLIRGLAG